jgi:ABC-type transport system involved in cytochrome c biogenesis permease subunit
VFAFLAAIAFLFVYWRYSFASLSICVFPLVYLSTQVGTMQFGSAGWADARVRDAWLLVHVMLIMVGYAALVVMALASVFYLVQERRLKMKVAGGPADRLPPLGTLDNIVTRAMAVGFVFITLGVIAGTTWAYFESGTNWIGDPKIGISFFTWALCLLMIFLRATAGWRGRKAAVLSLSVLGSLALTWVAHVGLTRTLGR